jgi:hypothetical protein
MNWVLRISVAVAIGVAGATSYAEQPSLWSRTLATTASGTKKVLNTTVDVVTLKPVRDHFAPKKSKSDLGLGFKPDPRKKQPTSSGLFGSWFQSKKSSGSPQTVGEFLSLDRPR